MRRALGYPIDQLIGNPVGVVLAEYGDVTADPLADGILQIPVSDDAGDVAPGAAPRYTKPRSTRRRSVDRRFEATESEG